MESKRVHWESRIQERLPTWTKPLYHYALLRAQHILIEVKNLFGYVVESDQLQWDAHSIVWRPVHRLATKCAGNQIMEAMGSLLVPYQLRYGSPHAPEVAVHAALTISFKIYSNAT